MNKLTPQETIVMITSVGLGLLDSAVKCRAMSLGGWDKAVKKQGIFETKEKSIKLLQEAENTLFGAMNKADGMIVKSVTHMKDTAGFIGYNPKENIYLYAGKITNEMHRLINCFNEGHVDDVTYTDGYRTALANMEELMFKKKYSREKALQELRELVPEVKPLDPNAKQPEPIEVERK